jgi:hypothetical protein
LALPKEFWDQDRKIYYYKKDNEESFSVGGYFRTHGSFSLIAVPKAGHFVPHDNFMAAKSFLDDMVMHGEL